jgi:hypothetical protein
VSLVKLLLVLLLSVEDRFVSGRVRMLMVALAVVVAVARSVARAFLESRRSGAAAGAVGALVQLVPQVGVGRVSCDQCASDRLAVDAAVDSLVLVHAHAQVLQDSFERLVIDAIATATHTLVHQDILVQGVLGDVVILVNEGMDVLVLVDVSTDHGWCDFLVDIYVLTVCVARVHCKGHARHAVGKLIHGRHHSSVQKSANYCLSLYTDICFVIHQQLQTRHTIFLASAQRGCHANNPNTIHILNIHIGFGTDKYFQTVSVITECCIVH